jgi:endonuclease/exonuclease/phosphatase family metal-dependent hydrolase
VAARFDVGVQDLFALNSRFCAAGVAGLMNDEAGSWLERLSAADTILRRLDMIYLVRCGTPAALVAEQYGAVPEYVQRIVRRFEKHGVPGILTEKDLQLFRALHPPALRICSYNLHGVHNDGLSRFRRIARHLADADAHVAALQEVVSGSGIEDTGRQIARWASSITGEAYTTEFAYCHQFMDRYPEGIAIATRWRPKGTTTLDLTRLRDGLRPALPRKALVMEADVFGRTAAVVSVHLDHGAEPQVRLAQAEKLVREVEQQTKNRADYVILAGDFNDADDSPTIRFLLAAGYRDAYRACHRETGNTYPAGNPTARIDYIFVKGAAEIRSSGLLPNDPELSDHIGVFAEIV